MNPTCETQFSDGPCKAVAVAVVSEIKSGVQSDACADCYRDKVLHDSTHTLIDAYDLGAVATIKALTQ